MQRQEMRAPVVITLIRNITIALLSFISFPFAAQALGDVAMGQYSWAHTFVHYFLILSRLGIPLIAIRECAKVKDNQELLNQKVKTFFVLQLITTLASYLLMAGVLFIGRDVVAPLEIRNLIFLLSINFLVGVFSFEWVYIAFDKVFYMAMRTILTTIFTVILIIIFVQNNRHLFIYAFINIIMTLVTVVINVVNLRKLGVKLNTKEKVERGYITKSFLFVFLITFIITAYNQNDSLILGYLDPTKSAVGSYAVGVRGIEIVITIITSLSAVFMIRTTKALEDQNMKAFHNIVSYSMNIIFFIGVPALMFMIALAPEIVRFIVTSPYWHPSAVKNAEIAVMMLASLMLTYSLHDSIYQQVLIPLKREKTYFVIMFSALAFNIVFSVIGALFIFPDNKMFAVALATLLSEAIALITLFILMKDYFIKHVANLNNLKIIVSSAISLGVTLVIKNYINLEPLVTIITTIAIGGVFYIALLFLLKEDIVKSLFKKEKTNGEPTV